MVVVVVVTVTAVVVVVAWSFINQLINQKDS